MKTKAEQKDVLIEEEDEEVNAQVNAETRNETPKSRHGILQELQGYGINVGALESMSMEALEELLMGVRAMVSAHASQNKRGRPKGNGGLVPIFSNSDKKILHRLMDSTGNVSSLVLSRELDIPLTTVQRRKNRLEANLIDISYSLNVEKVGWRMATLFVSTSEGKIDIVGKRILEIDDMVASVTRMIGENTIDMKVEVIFRTNKELLSLIDRVKSMEGIKNIFWSESMGLIGKSGKCYHKIIDSLGADE